MQVAAHRQTVCRSFRLWDYDYGCRTCRQFGQINANLHGVIGIAVIDANTLPLSTLIHNQTTNFRLFQTESLPTTISNLTKITESYPNG